MELLLAIALISVVEVVILTLGFRSFERAEEARARIEVETGARDDRSRSRFFGDAPIRGAADDAALQALVLRLERHVKLEQQAAQWFLDNPTAETLHHHPVGRLHVTH